MFFFFHCFAASAHFLAPLKEFLAGEEATKQERSLDSPPTLPLNGIPHVGGGINLIGGEKRGARQSRRHISKSSRFSLRKLGAMVPEERRWPNNTLIYTFANIKTDEKMKNMAISAMNMIIKQTKGKACLKFKEFIPEKGEIDYCFKCGSFQNGRPIGQTGMVGNRQPINYRETSGIGSIMHEILHAAGFPHEQSRPDRDEYINVFWDNISDENQYAKMPPSYTSFGTPFDWLSLMIYGNGSGVNKKGAASMEAKDKKDQHWLEDKDTRAQREMMSPLDIKVLAAAYPCKPGGGVTIKYELISPTSDVKCAAVSGEDPKYKFIMNTNKAECEDRCKAYTGGTCYGYSYSNWRKCLLWLERLSLSIFKKNSKGWRGCWIRKESIGAGEVVEEIPCQGTEGCTEPWLPKNWKADQTNEEFRKTLIAMRKHNDGEEEDTEEEAAKKAAVEKAAAEKAAAGKAAASEVPHPLAFARGGTGRQLRLAEEENLPFVEAVGAENDEKEAMTE